MAVKPGLVLSEWAWCVVVCAPYKICDVDRDARALGLEPLLLLERTWKKVRCKGKRTREPSDRPLFGSYLIVGLPGPTPEYAALRSVRSVVAFVGVSGRPLHVPAASVAWLIEGASSGLFDRTRKEKPVLFAGDKARVTGGPFIGFEVVVNKDAYMGNVADVDIPLFGRLSHGTIPLEWLVGV